MDEQEIHQQELAEGIVNYNEMQEALGYGASVPEPKMNVHTFLKNVVQAKDTKKLGYLSAEELGNPKHPVRTYQNISLIAGKLMDNPDLQSYFEQKSEIITATSLSKDAKLIDLAVMQRREFGKPEGRKQMKENKGWFRRKNKDGEEST